MISTNPIRTEYTNAFDLYARLSVNYYAAPNKLSRTLYLFPFALWHNFSHLFNEQISRTNIVVNCIVTIALIWATIWKSFPICISGNISITAQWLSQLILPKANAISTQICIVLYSFIRHCQNTKKSHHSEPNESEPVMVQTIN